MKIIELTKENYSRFAREIAGIHKSAYSSHHMTAHFSQAMLEEYYRCLVNESDLCILALDGSENNEGRLNARVIGFIVAGAAVSKGVASFLRSNRFYVFSLMLKNPMFLWKKITSLFLTRLIREKPSAAKFRLLSIGVFGSYQSAGVGKAMVSFFEDELRKSGVDSYGLSVRTENERAISFYQKNGFKFERIFVGSAYFTKFLGNK